MKDKPNDLLLLAGKILTLVIQGATAIGATALVISIPFILFYREKIDAEIRAEYGDAISTFPVPTVIGLMALLLVFLGIGFVFFGKLRTIISTVGDGDPFVPENADRLNLMAWLALSAQLLMIPVAAFAVMIVTWAEQLEQSDISIDGGFDLTGFLLVIVLFILARIFKHGTEMRDDLEGTV